MKKRMVSVLLTVLLALSLLPCAAMADDYELDMSEPPRISELQIVQEGSGAYLQINLRTPTSVHNLIDLLGVFGKTHYLNGLQLSASLGGGDWQQWNMFFDGTGDQWNGTWRTEIVSGLKSDSWVRACARYTGVDNDGNPVLSDWSEVLTINENSAPTFEFNAHDWAKPELADADALGLIPAGLRASDLKLPITRAEFAAVSVKVYEALSGLTAEPAAENPFTDTADAEVLKALGVGITNGLSDTTFGPDAYLNREQAATMLSRVYKKVAFEGWTLATDGDYAEQFRALFTMPEAFADDADISSWARDSVYFMAYNGILKGMEGYTFQPRAVTPEQQASGYAQATREQAILIAVRLVQNLSAS